MNRNNLIPNTLIVIAIIGIALSMYGKANPEFGSSVWAHLAPYSIWLATVFCLVAMFVTFPRKRLVDKQVKRFLYLKPIFWCCLLIFYWLQEFGVIYT